MRGGVTKGEEKRGREGGRGEMPIAELGSNIVCLVRQVQRARHRSDEKRRRNTNGSELREVKNETSKTHRRK